MNPVAIALLFGFPVLLIALNEGVQRTHRPYPRASQSLRMFRNTVVPLAAATILAHYVFGLPWDNTTVRILFTGAAIAGLNAGIAVLNASFVSNNKAGIPNLLLDIIRLVVVLAGGALIISTIWDEPIGQLFTALGVGGVVIGLALQGTLSNLFSGLAILSEQAVSIGDWIKLDEDTMGQVTKITWRSMTLLTLEGTSVILTNDALAGQKIEKLARADGLMELQLVVEVIPSVPPELIREAFMEAAAQTPHHDGRAMVTFEGYSPRGMNVEMALLLEDYTKADAAKDAFYSLVWYACQRRSITLVGAGFRHYDIRPDEHVEGASAAERLALLTASQALDMDADIVARVAEHAIYQRWRRGEFIMSPTQASRGVVIMLSGSVMVEIEESGRVTELEKLSPGSAYALHASLRGDPSPSSLRALTDCAVLLLPSAIAEHLAADSGAFASYLDNVIDDCEREIRDILAETGIKQRFAPRLVGTAPPSDETA